MIIKILGGILTVLSSHFFATIMFSELTGRLSLLKEFKNSLIFIKCEIEFTKTPIMDIIVRLSLKDGEISGIYKNFLNEFEICGDIEEAWNKCIDFFKTERLSILKGFTTCFTAMDIEGQMSKINAFIIDVDKEITKLDEYIEKNTKLYKNAGLYAGILITVLLL